MSHFSVLVVGDPEYQLAPFHEFECTGKDDEFVKDVDITEEARKQYTEATERVFEDAEGIQFDAYDDRFYREPTKEEQKEMGSLCGTGGNSKIQWSSKDWEDGKGYRAKVHFVPTGFTDKRVPMRMPFLDWVEDYYGIKRIKKGSRVKGKDYQYGYVLLDAKGEATKVIARTNPNKKWDWWQAGGRYSNKLILKDGRHADSAKKSEIDFERMRKGRVAKQTTYWQSIHSVIDHLPPMRSWKDVLAECKDDAEKAREIYHKQERKVALRGASDKNKDLVWVEEPEIMATLEEWLAQYQVFTTFAAVKDRKWYERGEMGWWACVSNEKEGKTWEQELAALLDSVGNDEVLTVVDCHI